MRTTTLSASILAFVVGLTSLDLSFGFHSNFQQKTSFCNSPSTTVIDNPIRERVDRKTGGGDLLGEKEDNFRDELRKQGPLEWLEDEAESRNMEDPFHILLLQQTFEKPRITVPYVASSLEYVLTMPIDEATELSQFSHDHGMSCLGVWPREQCLTLGRQLQVRDIVCRIVPYVDGGRRAWQAKEASGAGSVSNSDM